MVEMKENNKYRFGTICGRLKKTSIVVIVTGLFLSTRLLIHIINEIGTSPGRILTAKPTISESPLNCAEYGRTGTCPATHKQDQQNHNLSDQQTGATCPDYFRWIHEDLRPWAREGITRASLERAHSMAHFKLVIVKGRAYVEKYRKAYETRDVYTVWGVVQLLRRYPGKVPDLELMFNCGDRPEDIVDEESGGGPSVTGGLSGVPPSPLFRYCGDGDQNYIVFPDWTFWGWPETNVKPWDGLLKDLKEGNKRSKWIDRKPYAYWRGNPFVSETRHQLMRCNISNKQKHDWNVRIYPINWTQESQMGYKESNVAAQCNHRYKIYVEGWAWSVSGKYILACDSPTLYVKSKYYDFFTRSLMPLHHYWPIRDDDQCKSIKFAVDWGNSHMQKAQELGKAASEFIQEELKMDYVYDYMFHLLNEYAKLLKFNPSIPRNAVELCSESMACPAEGSERKFKEESMVEGAFDNGPLCKLPPPYDTRSLDALITRKANSIKQVEMWERSYYKNQNKYSHVS